MKKFLLALVAALLLLAQSAHAQNVTQKFTLTWKNNDTNGTGTNIYRRMAGEPVPTDPAFRLLGAALATYNETVSGPAGTQVFYSVSRFNATGESARTPEVPGNLPAATADTTAPVVSIAPLQSPLRGSVSIQVLATDAVGVTQVELLIDNVMVQTKTAAPWTFTVDTKPFADGVYVLSARAKDAAGNVGQSAIVAVSTVNSAPIAPVGLTISAVNTSSIDISWANGAVPIAVQMVPTEIVRSAPFDPYTSLRVVRVAAGIYSMRDTGLGSGQTFCYRARAVAGALLSEFSDVRCGTTR